MTNSAIRAAVFSTLCLLHSASPADLQKIEVTVERKVGDRVERMDPNHVFQQGDMVRFRFKPSFDGYLYVMDHSTSGRYVLLFPKEETGMQNRIERNRSYLLPMTDSGWFRVEGPAGHEVLYWVVSPARLNDSGTSAFGVPKLPADSGPLDGAITPRCDDSIFQARGDCIDVTAGAQAVKNSNELPPTISPLADPKARELTVTKSDKKTAVVAPSGNDAPFVYTFHLAHK